MVQLKMEINYLCKKVHTLLERNNLLESYNCKELTDRPFFDPFINTDGEFYLNESMYNHELTSKCAHMLTCDNSLSSDTMMDTHLTGFVTKSMITCVVVIQLR